MLKSAGFEVVAKASNGEEAVKIFNQLDEKPDIILMDHRMPIKSGVEATKEILQTSHNTKIIFASADSSVKSLAISTGATSFLEKPFGCESLINEIKKLSNNIVLMSN